MSSHEDVDPDGAEGSGREALARLEETVGRLLEELQDLRNRTGYAERRREAVEKELSRFVEGEQDPGALVERLTDLESRNRELNERLEEGREGVERLLARIRFLEEQVS